ncbi:hypothetical protein EDC04DRAFT_2611639 [Pisolithus marmoratus]|nr:hypothetical protein EDC04DRAFT_2611639 [Pisolithus marmoratus]
MQSSRLYLTHHQGVNEKHCKFILDDKHASYHGFTHCSTYPHEFKGSAVTLSSLTDDLIVIVYTNNNARSHFAVGLLYYLGQGWAHIDCDGHFPTQDEDLTNLAGEHTIKCGFMPTFPNQSGLQGSSGVGGRWAISGLWLMSSNVLVAVMGHADGWLQMPNDCGDIGMLGHMKMVQRSYWLALDGWDARFDKCSGQWTASGNDTWVAYSEENNSKVLGYREYFYALVNMVPSLITV